MWLQSFIEALSTACDGNVELQAPLSANSRRGASTHSHAVAKERGPSSAHSGRTSSSLSALWGSKVLVMSLQQLPLGTAVVPVLFFRFVSSRSSK